VVSVVMLATLALVEQSPADLLVKGEGRNRVLVPGPPLLVVLPERVEADARLPDQPRRQLLHVAPRRVHQRRCGRTLLLLGRR